MNYSVIIPTYNRAAFVGRAIKSVANQDGVDRSQVEIIVIDDGSADNTPQVIASLNAAPATLIYLRRPHVGQPGTVRNAGLEQAKGEFIAYCDSDDFWLPHHLATAAAEFKEDPSLMMVMNYWGLAKFTLLPNGGIQNDIVVPGHPTWAVNTNCRVHRKECLSRVGKFNAKRWGEDGDFFNSIENTLKCKKVLIVTSINGYIRGGNNLSYEFDNGIRNTYSR